MRYAIQKTVMDNDKYTNKDKDGKAPTKMG